ncbi:MAG: trypsin-like peptidase domain-containing protein [Clostridiales bacterium]|nr:trypsin-like peptidase domain-containing protein [Clostridiales bacterium]
MEKRRKVAIKYLVLFICVILSLLIFSACTQTPCNHIESTWIIDKEATLDEEGIKHTECTICGEPLKSETIRKIKLTSEEIRLKLTKSIVEIYSYDIDGTTLLSQGSGFFIDENGTFITNAHVVKDCYFLKASYELTTYDVKFIHVYNETLDYAICKIDMPLKSIPVEFATDVNVGDVVYALGYPNGNLSFTKGQITSTNAVDGQKDFYESTAFIDHGSSGGILSNDKGRILGITTAKFVGDRYLTLKYSEFKEDISKSYSVSKKPLEYFHTVEKVNVTALNVDKYFDVYLTKDVLSATSVNYNIKVALKKEYENKKIGIENNLTITLKLKTEYVYLGIGETIGEQTTVDLKTLYFNFYNKNDLINGNWQSVKSEVYIPLYYGMQIYYDVEILDCLGTILIYN